jgi:apolipoprotein N-acyltransferase
MVLGAASSIPLVATGWWLLALAAAAGLAGLLRSAPAWRAAQRAIAFGFGGLAATVWWLFISLHHYGNLPAWMAVGAVAALALTLSLQCGVFALFAAWRSSRPLIDAALFAALWLAAELLRTTLFTGFPWGASGYALIDSPLAALAPWVGVHGIGFVGALVAALSMLGGMAGRPGRPAIVLAAVLLGGVGLMGPVDFTRSNGELPVSLIQTNVAQDEKFAAQRMPQTLAELAQALIDSPAGLVVAPETAMPLLPGQLDEADPAFWSRLKPAFSSPSRAALIGMPLGDFDRGYTNSVVAFGAGPAYRYDKVHLVPFGEFIPYGFRWFTRLMGIPLGDFDRGVPNAPSYPFAGQWLAPNICYEDLFGDELAQRFAGPAAAPTVFVNVSNIAWFGDSSAIPQHLNISRMRAIEFQRPMLRATNTGATAIIDHHGRVTASLAPFVRARLDGRVDGRTGMTPFARWSAAAGLWPLAGAVGLVLVAARHRARAARPPGVAGPAR